MQQASLGEQLVDGGQNLIGQLVFFQPMTKAQDGALVGQAVELAQLDKLALDRGVEEGLFHAGVREAEPLLQEVGAQHGARREQRAAGAAFGVVRGDEVDQRSPRNDLLHLGKELALAGLFRRQIKAEVSLLHVKEARNSCAVRHAGGGRGFAECPHR